MSNPGLIRIIMCDILRIFGTLTLYFWVYCFNHLFKVMPIFVRALVTNPLVQKTYNRIHIKRFTYILLRLYEMRTPYLTLFDTFILSKVEIHSWYDSFIILSVIIFFIFCFSSIYRRPVPIHPINSLVSYPVLYMPQLHEYAWLDLELD